MNVTDRPRGHVSPLVAIATLGPPFLRLTRPPLKLEQDTGEVGLPLARELSPTVTVQWARQRRPAGQAKARRRSGGLEDSGVD